MNCPNCYSNLGNESICPHCGVDVLLFAKTNNISDGYYNQGLAEASVRNLSGAIRSLSKSVEYNRFNCQARNLLGLVYFETGMIGDALRHWVISAGYMKDKNPAAQYIDEIQSDNRLLDRHGESIHLYNNALEDLKYKKDDMAVIQLKKALDSNPNLVYAYNLLALCYIYQKANDKALRMVEKALEIDRGNEISLSYYRLLNVGKTKPSAKDKAENEPRKSRYNTKKSISNSFHIAEILTFLLGVACAFGIFYILIMPDVITAHNEDIEKINASVTQTNQTYAEELNKKDAEISQLESDKQRIEKANEQLADEFELQTRINKVNLALVVMLDGEYEEAAAMVESIDITNFSTSAVKLYNYVKETTYPVLEKNFYDEGLRQFNARNYTGAKELFEKSLLYLTPGSSYADGDYYFLGRIAEIEGDKDTARTYYNIIINEYPNSYQSQNARNRLRNL